MADINIVPSTVAHVRELQKSLRSEDRLELEALGLNPSHSIFSSYRKSILRKTCLVNGKVGAMWGVSGTPLSLTGQPYLITGEPVLEMSFLRFARIYKQEVLEMSRLFPLLENYVHSNYHGAVRLLKMSGFIISKPVYINGNMFRKFSYS